MLGFRKTKKTHDAKWVRGVVDRYESMLLRYAMRKTGDRETAEDLVQSAFLKLIKNPQVGDAQLPQWLYTVIANEFLDGRRAAVVRAQSVADVPLSETAPSAVKQLMTADDLDCLMKALAALTELQRRVVELRFIDELSYDEISAQIEKTRNHVGVLLHESLKRLRVEHEEHCGEYLDGVPV